MHRSLASATTPPPPPPVAVAASLAAGMKCSLEILQLAPGIVFGSALTFVHLHHVDSEAL